MEKKSNFIKKLLVGILAALGVLFIILMILPDDEEDPGNDVRQRQEADVDVTATASPQEKTPSHSVRVVSVGRSTKSATVMIYVNGSDLESENGEASEDISEMLASGIGSNVNVVLQTMGTKKWKDYGISSKTAQTYTIENGKLNLVRDKLGQLDCTAADTLSEFIGYCKDNYPAERYFFLFWDHGGGPVYGFGYDEWQDEDDSLTIAEMSEAFSEHTDIHFDIIGMDCCIMASLETCYALAPYCKYTLLSEDFESALGWSYTGWMKSLEENPGISTTLLGKYIIDDIIETNESETYGDSTCMGLFNVSTSQTLFNTWKAWAYKNESALMKKNYSRQHRAKKRNGRGLFDYWGFDESDVTLSDYYISDILAIVENIDNKSDEAKALTSALKASVAYYGHTSEKNELTGLAVSLPYGDSKFYKQLKKVYTDVGFDSEYIDWLKGFVSSSGNSSYYDYEDFYDNWGGWGSYEHDYGSNYSGGGYGQYSWDYGWDDDYNWGGWFDDDDYYDYGDCYGYDYYHDSPYDYGHDEGGYTDDWLYDFESGLWYWYEGDNLYLYDDEEDMLYYYDEEEDILYYYDDRKDDWLIYD